MSVDFLQTKTAVCGVYCSSQFSDDRFKEWNEGIFGSSDRNLLLFVLWATGSSFLGNSIHMWALTSSRMVNVSCLF